MKRKTYSSRWLYYRFADILSAFFFIIIMSIILWDFTIIDNLMGPVVGVFFWYAFTLYFPLLIILLGVFWKKEFLSVKSRFLSEIGILIAHYTLSVILIAIFNDKNLKYALLYEAFLPIILIIQFLTFCWLEEKSVKVIITELVKTTTK